jgi:hypothetical protein
MKERSGFLFLAMLILALLAGACGPDSSMDLEEVLDPEIEVISDNSRDQYAGEGNADIYYHYHNISADLKFKIDMPFAVNFAETDQGGFFDVQGINEDWVTFTMAAGGGPTGRCEFTCQVYLRWVATGSITMGEEGECQIPMQFTFVPQGDFILDGDCPQEAMDVIDCNMLALVMADPTTYEFLATDTELYVPSEAGVKREAEIKNLIFPEDMRGTCTWQR